MNFLISYECSLLELVNQMWHNVSCLAVQRMEFKAVEIWNMYVTKANHSDPKNI